MVSEQDVQAKIERLRRRFSLDLAPGEDPLYVYIRHWTVFVRRIWWLAVVLLLTLLVGRWWLSRPRGDLPLAPGVLLGAVLLLAGILAIFFWVDWRNDALIMTSQRLLHVERVILFFQSQRETSLSNVQNIRSDVRGFIARILKYGEIEIETAARGMDIVFGPIHDPRSTQQEIMMRVQSIRAEASKKLREQTIRHLIDPERHPAPELPQLVEQEEPRSAGVHLWQAVFPPNPRVEGGRITWYTHRYFLLRRLFVFLLLLALLAAAAFFLFNMEAPSSSWLVWGGGLLVILFFIVVNYQIWLGDIYVVTADTMFDVNRTPFGLFGESRRAASLDRIQNITFEQPGLLANLLNFGDVRIQTAGQEDFTFDRVPNPGSVQREIYRRQRLHRAREEQRRYQEEFSSLIIFQTAAMPPNITKLRPASVLAGESGFTLEIDGSNMVPGSIVRWNGANRPTDLIDSRRVVAQISASDVSEPGVVVVTVVNPDPGGVSNALSFTVNNPKPVIVRLTPTSVLAGGAEFTLTVRGGDLVRDSIVQWNGWDQRTKFVHGGQLEARIRAEDIAESGVVTVTIVTPGPGGGVSNARRFVIRER